MIEQIVIISLFCCGLKASTSHGYLLHFVKRGLVALLGGTITWRPDFIEEEVKLKWGNDIYKPILGCVTCMASVWGVIIYSLLNDYTIASIYTLPMIILACSALNTLIWGYLKDFI